MPGTLEACKTCSGDGLLHRPDQFPEYLKLLAQPIGGDFEFFRQMTGLRSTNQIRRGKSDHQSPMAMDFDATDWIPLPLPLIPETAKYKVGNRVKFLAHHYVIQGIGSNPDGSHRFMQLNRILNPISDIPPDHLVLGYELGTVDHQPGSVLLTHNSEYVVDGIFERNLYVTRKDLWG